MSACGESSSHDLALLLDAEAAVQLHTAPQQMPENSARHEEVFMQPREAAMQLPAIAQAFIDHEGVLHKVYCIGTEVSQPAQLVAASHSPNFDQSQLTGLRKHALICGIPASLRSTARRPAC